MQRLAVRSQKERSSRREETLIDSGFRKNGVSLPRLLRGSMACRHGGWVRGTGRQLNARIHNTLMNHDEHSQPANNANSNNNPNSGNDAHSTNQPKPPSPPPSKDNLHVPGKRRKTRKRPSPAEEQQLREEVRRRVASPVPSRAGEKVPTKVLAWEHRLRCRAKADSDEEAARVLGESARSVARAKERFGPILDYPRSTPPEERTPLPPPVDNSETSTDD